MIQPSSVYSCGLTDKLSPCLIDGEQQSTLIPYHDKGEVLNLQCLGYSQHKTYQMTFLPAFLSISKGAYLRISLVRLRLCLHPDPLGQPQ